MHPEEWDLGSEDPQTLLCIPLVTSQHPPQGWAAADCPSPSTQLLNQHPALWMETPKAAHPSEFPKESRACHSSKDPWMMPSLDGMTQRACESTH